MSCFKGMKLDFVKVEETVTVHWKQGSVLGFGGDRSQTYNRCKYTMGQGFVQVYIDSTRPTDKQLIIDNCMRYGMNEGILFFVLDNHENKPYQHRFIQNATQKTLYQANDYIKTSGFDLAWVAGDYLRTIP